MQRSKILPRVRFQSSSFHICSSVVIYVTIASIINICIYTYIVYRLMYPPLPIHQISSIFVNVGFRLYPLGSMQAQECECKRNKLWVWFPLQGKIYRVKKMKILISSICSSGHRTHDLSCLHLYFVTLRHNWSRMTFFIHIF